MTRWIAPLLLAASALVACAGEAPATSSAPALALTPTDTLWLAPDATGYAAQVAWGLPLPVDFAVTEVSPEQLRAICLQADGALASELVAGCAHGSVISIRDNLAPGERAAVLLHEMGHVLAHRHGHIDDPVACPEGKGGLYVMCAESDGTIEAPMPQDFDFVLAAR
jgi:hypothetical protein